MEYLRQGTFIQLTIDKKYAGLSIDHFFKQFHQSRKQIHEYRMSHQVYLNDQPVHQHFHVQLKENDQLRFPFFIEEAIDFIPEDQPIDIVYEDDFILVVNKPVPLLVHPSEKTGTGTLVNYVSHYYQATKQFQRIRYIHRLDRETSGLIVFAKTPFVHRYYDQLLQNQSIKRFYLAVVSGVPQSKKGSIEGYIARDRHQSNKMRLANKGAYSKTNYRVIKYNKRYSLIECELLTGRTHQIRVHLSSIGHPIVGDELYQLNSEPLGRHLLHAYHIQIPHLLTGEILNITCEMPSEMKSFIQKTDH